MAPSRAARRRVCLWLRLWCGHTDQRMVHAAKDGMEWARYTGAGTLWNDAAWYDEFGNWNSPEWSQTHKYVKIHERKMPNWMWSAVAYPGSRAEKEAGPLLTDLTDRPAIPDQSKPEVTNGSSRNAGWYGIPLGATSSGGMIMPRPSGTLDRLAADQEFRRM